MARQNAQLARDGSDARTTATPAAPRMRLVGWEAPAGAKGSERRQHRRHDLEPKGIPVERVDGAQDGSRRTRQSLGRIVDLSAGGVRIRTEQPDIQPDHQIRVRLELPSYAGICPFVDKSGRELQPKREWVGWMTVARVSKTGERQFDVAGQLMDMEEVDRGMLGLYLSTQPMAA